MSWWTKAQQIFGCGAMLQWDLATVCLETGSFCDDGMNGISYNKQN